MFWLLSFTLLVIFCWPIALLLAIFVPFLWLLSIPFRIVGFVLEGLLAFIRQLFLLPARLLENIGARNTR
jgi:hypothetical protein